MGDKQGSVAVLMPENDLVTVLAHEYDMKTGLANGNELLTASDWVTAVACSALLL